MTYMAIDNITYSVVGSNVKNLIMLYRLKLLGHCFAKDIDLRFYVCLRICFVCLWKNGIHT